MNAAREHTDGCRAEGDTTKILAQTLTPIGRADDLTSIDFAAGIYLIQNQDRPEAEWDDLPENLTADDVVRAIARQNERKQLNRIAIKAHEKALSTALPKSATVYLCQVKNCQRPISAPGYCQDCGAHFTGTPAPIPWSTILWCLLAVSAFIVAIAFVVRQ